MNCITSNIDTLSILAITINILTITLGVLAITTDVLPSQILIYIIILNCTILDFLIVNTQNK